MAHSHNTDKGRLGRILNRVFLEAFNGGDHVAAHDAWVEQRELAVDGRRYGNKRKSMADEKVQARRTARKRGRQATRNEVLEA